ncbi:MAG: serpin family protein [Lachnospiraceae bacterium]|nr:serpin family protein [Lachnospiraceae bacterium]
MKKQMNKVIKISAAFLLCAISLCGCKQEEQMNNYMENVTANQISVNPECVTQNAGKVAGFSVRLFQQSLDSQSNTLVSPVSVMYAFGMIANGADGDTLLQMEELFGMSGAEVNECMYVLKSTLPQSPRCKVDITNSITLNEEGNLALENDFLQTNADYYGSEICSTQLDEGTNMILNNAVSFDAEWEYIYYPNDVHEREFTKEDGTVQTVPMMASDEYSFVEDDKATGFIKKYADNEYAFMALLPNEGIGLDDYVAGLTGEHVINLYHNPQDILTYTRLPKFETECDMEMNDVLKNMGMTDAWDMQAADFSKVGNNNGNGLYISRATHKTKIVVDELGTRAQAETDIAAAAASEALEYREVYLNRPFVYLIMDCENGIPLFIGTVREI